MDYALILKIDFDGQSKMMRVDQSSSFKNIIEEITATWSNLSTGNFSALYSVGSTKNCCFGSDSYLMGLIEFCKFSSEKLVNISIVMPHFHESANHDNSRLLSVHVSTSLDNTIIDSPSLVNNSKSSTNREIVGNPPSQESVTTEFVGCGSIPHFDICPIEKKKSYLSDHWSGIMGVGVRFAGGAPEFRIELIKYSIKLNFKYTFTKNCPRYVYAICSQKNYVNCGWFIKARQTPMDSGFIVSKANLVHTCVRNLFDEDKKRLGTKIIKELVLPSVKANPKISVSTIIIDIKKDYGLDLPYYKAWRGVEAARDDIFGSYDQSYDQLRWYGEAVKRTNPGSIIDLEVNRDTHHFERMFISFYACKEGFKHCRPMLFIDGTFMKGRSKGVLLATTAKDGNNGLFPVAFYVVSAENRDNWAWFLNKIKDNIFHPKQTIFISDRNTGLMSAFYDVWDQPPHFYCLFHLIMNLKGKFGGGWNTQHRENMAVLFKQCAYAPNTRIFNEKIKIFKDVGGPIAEKWLEDLPYPHWAVSHSQNIKRYGEMTSNAAESFNSWISEARALPITHMIDSIRSKISIMFVERRQISSTWTGLLVPSKEELWHELANVGASWNVSLYPNGQYLVGSKTSVTVDLEYNICTCFQWQITGFPCAHAVAVIKKNCTSIANVVEECFTASNYKQCYEIDLMPVPETERYEFKATSDVQLVHPPILKKPPGRPKQKRITSYGEFRRVKPTTCSRCGKTGRHDLQTCAMIFGTDRTNYDS